MWKAFSVEKAAIRGFDEADQGTGRAVVLHSGHVYTFSKYLETVRV